VLQKIHDSHGKAIWALLAAFLIYQLIVFLSQPLFSRFGIAGPLLGSIASAVVAIVGGAWAIHVFFSKISSDADLSKVAESAERAIDPSEKAELQGDVAAYQTGRNEVGNVLGLIGIAIVAFVLFRIVQVVPIVLEALGWKPQALTNTLGSGGTVAVSVAIAVASLIFWFVALNYVFRKLEAQPA
jgi:hypothetical protein